MSFDHWLIRQFAVHADDIPTGLTAWGDKGHELEAHFSMLGHGISFVSFGVDQIPNRFTSFVRERLAMPVITWTVRDESGREGTITVPAGPNQVEPFDPPVTLVEWHRDDALPRLAERDRDHAELRRGHPDATFVVEPLPPVSLFRVGEAYFVRDGHHRVSVARAMGNQVIEADVTEVITDVVNESLSLKPTDCHSVVE